jgi:hypothetical protein
MNVKVWAIGACSALLAAYGAGLFYEGYLAKSYSGALTYPFVDRPAAERAYNTLANDAPLAARDQAVGRLLRADPANARNWTLVSYIDWLHHGQRLSPAGVAAFDRSYTMSPFDPDAAPWRVNFALENWTALSASQRVAVISETSWMFQHDMQTAADLKARLKTIRNPAGRAMARLELVLAPPG